MELQHGEGRTAVRVTWNQMGSGLIVCLANDNAHIGAVALGEYDTREGRASTSVMTRLGHKDDHVATRAAHRLAKELRQPVCVIAGIHVDQITEAEIATIGANCDALVERVLTMLLTTVSTEDQSPPSS
jgi:gallate decarboxylase subunit D